jgi:hypothetical protein
MSQENVLDDEDQMAAAFAEIRNDRAEEPAVVVEAKETPAEPVAVPETPAPQESATPADPAPVDPNEQLRLAQAELHKARSEIGRVSALNSKYHQATQEIAQLREQLEKVRQAPVQTAQDSAETADKLAAVAEQVKDFPELAGIVAAVSDALKQADKKTEEVARRVAAQVVEPLEPLRREQTSRLQNEQQAAYDAALATFNSTYPNAVEVIQSDDFKSWLTNQPGHIQYAFSKGQTPQEAMSVLDTYDMHLRRTGKDPVAQITSTPAKAAPAPAASTSNASRLQRAAGIPSRPSGSQGSQPPADDFEGALNYFRNKRLQANRLVA